MINHPSASTFHTKIIINTNASAQMKMSPSNHAENILNVHTQRVDKNILPTQKKMEKHKFPLLRTLFCVCWMVRVGCLCRTHTLAISHTLRTEIGVDIWSVETRVKLLRFV